MQLLRAGQLPGGLQQPAAQYVKMAVQRGKLVQGHRDLQLPGRGQPGRGCPQRGQALAGAQALPAELRRALMEQCRMDPLRPGGVLDPQVVVGLQQRPAFQDVRGRDPALGQPPVRQQLPQVPGIGLIRLGVPLAAPQSGGVRRLGDMRGDPGHGQFLSHIPPPGAPLHGEVHVLAGEPARQPCGQMLTIGRRDLPAPHLPRGSVEIVEGDLLPVNVQPAYDGHRDLLTLPRAQQAPARECAYTEIITRLSWGGLPLTGNPARQLSRYRGTRCMSSLGSPTPVTPWTCA